MLKLDFSKTIYNQLASAALDEIKDHPHTEDEIRWYLSGIAFVAANFFSVRQQIRQEEREVIIEIIKQFVKPEDASTVIHAIRKRGEK
jgi:uncharacterized protein (UPF0297 family)